MKTKKDERPTIHDGAGMPRHDRYKAAIEHCNKAKKEGFFLEAIAIEESLIADRLESLTNEIKGGGWSYNPAGKLVWNLLKNYRLHLNEELIEWLKKVQVWCRTRNYAIHRMAKLTPDLKGSFDEDYSKLPAVTEEGMKVFRGLDNAIRKYRKSKAKTK
ncbi:MAG: hypothetical protein K5899_03670 [Bacteroidaceae bacterium]|nr:hypothetical protein [Bacteroidaceae bacterium]